MNRKKIITGIAAFCTALIAGVFYAFVVAVNPGLARLPDAEYLAAMQSINSAIVNPLFAISFFGAPLFLILASVVCYKESSASLVIAAAFIYLAGALLVTVLGNIPLNETLARINIDSATPETLHNTRQQFASAWNRWHAVRSAAAVVSLLLQLLAIVRKENPGKNVAMARN